MEVRDPEVRAIFFKGNERESETTAKFYMRKRRPNSICMFTLSSSAASSSLPCALSDVDVYDVSLRSKYIAYTYKNLPQCCCSVHANNLSCIQRKKTPTDGLSYGCAGNPNPTYFSVRPYQHLYMRWYCVEHLYCFAIRYVMFLSVNWLRC